jgi:hypothetical protein
MAFPSRLNPENYHTLIWLDGVWLLTFTLMTSFTQFAHSMCNEVVKSPQIHLLTFCSILINNSILNTLTQNSYMLSSSCVKVWQQCIVALLVCISCTIYFRNVELCFEETWVTGGSVISYKHCKSMYILLSAWMPLQPFEFLNVTQSVKRWWTSAYNQLHMD